MPADAFPVSIKRQNSSVAFNPLNYIFWDLKAYHP